MRYVMMALVMLWALGCGPSETTGDVGAGGATAAQGGGGQGGSSGGDDCHPKDPKCVHAAPVSGGPDCPMTMEDMHPIGPALPSAGLIDEEGNLISEAGALAVRCEPIGAVTLTEVSYHAVRGTGPCKATAHDAYVWIVPALPGMLRPADAIAHKATSAEELVFESIGGKAAVAPVVLPLGLSVEAGYLCIGVTLPAPSETHRACVGDCYSEDIDETPDLDLYSDTVGGVVQCPDANGECLLEPRDVSPTAAIGKQFDGAHRALRFRWAGLTNK